MSYEIDDNGVLTFLGSGDLFVRTVDCNRVTRIVAPLATTVDCRGCTKLTSLDLPSATTVWCRGCTNLTSLDLPSVTTVWCDGCTKLTSLDLPSATRVWCDGCTKLTSLDLPSATTVYCRGCTKLTPWFAPQVVGLLTGGGKSLNELESSVNWDCHEWSNCPMHTAFGADCIDDVPEQFRSKAAIFVGMFDAGLLSPPWAKCG